jgi:hypothetical protein
VVAELLRPDKAEVVHPDGGGVAAAVLPGGEAAEAEGVHRAGVPEGEALAAEAVIAGVVAAEEVPGAGNKKY